MEPNEPCDKNERKLMKECPLSSKLRIKQRLIFTFVIAALGCLTMNAVAQNSFPNGLTAGSGLNFSVSSSGSTTIVTPVSGPLLQIRQFGGGYGSTTSNAALALTTDNPSGASNYFMTGSIPGVTTYFLRADGTAYYAGNVGIGTSTPGAALDIASGYVTSTALQFTALRLAPAGSSGGYFGNGVAIALGAATNNGIMPVATLSSQLWNGGGAGVSNSSGALLFSTKNLSDAGPVGRILVDPAGNLGVGTTTPGAKLEVDGSVKLTAGSGASMTYQDGTVQTTAWNGVLGGGDYAESVDVRSGDRALYEPGDVLVIDPSAEGKFLRSSQPYSTAVMGIYSTNPGVVGRRQTTDKSHMKAEVPMAMVGVVPTKVNTEGGAIKPGDLLVTSSTPGYAMRGSDRSQLTGAIIGKALGHLDAGKGVIEVAVSIQ